VILAEIFFPESFDESLKRCDTGDISLLYKAPLNSIVYEPIGCEYFNRAYVQYGFLGADAQS